MKVKEVEEYFGSGMAAARAIGYHPRTFSTWKKRGKIPYLTQIRYEIVTKGKLKAENIMRD